MVDYILTQTAEEVQSLLNKIETFTFNENAPSGLIITCETDMILPETTVISLEDDKAIPADCTIIEHAYKVVGVTIQETVNGFVPIQIGGLLENLSWSWTLGMPIFLGVNGTLSQEPITTGGFSLILGYAISTTKMLIKFHEPIILD